MVEAVQRWELELPFRKPLSLNERLHWRERAERVRQWREAAFFLAKQQRIPACERVRVTLIYTPRDRRRRDPINLSASLKAAQDGLVDAGVTPDDTPQYQETMMPVITAPGPEVWGSRFRLVVERLD